MLELCRSGQDCRICLRSSFAQIMKAFMGRLMWSFPFPFNSCLSGLRGPGAGLRGGWGSFCLLVWEGRWKEEGGEGRRGRLPGKEGGKVGKGREGKEG